MNEFHISYHISISLLPWWKPSPRRRSSVLSVSLSPIFPILSSLLSSLVLTAASVLTNYSVWGWCRVSPERDFSQQLCKQTKPIRTFLLPPTRSLQPGHVTNFSNHISTRICAYYFSNISCLHTICLVWLEITDRQTIFLFWCGNLKVWFGFVSGSKVAPPHQS